MLTTNCDINEFRKVSGIYYIINLISKRKYIGSSINLYKRWKEHSRKTSNRELANDILKFGKENFIFKIVDYYETISVEELLKKELNELPQKQLVELCLSLSKYKKDNNWKCLYDLKFLLKLDFDIEKVFDLNYNT